MSDVATPDNEETGKRAIAKREWINDAGERIPTGSPDVKGVRYTYLDTGNSVEYRHGVNEVLDRQFAAMGAVTKLGNVVNTITNDDAYDGRDPVPEVIAWLDKAMKGEWREAGEGIARGPKYDKDIMAAVLVNLLGQKAAGDIAYYRDKLEDKSYYAKVRATTKVLAAYQAEMEKRGQAAGDVDGLA